MKNDSYYSLFIFNCSLLIINANQQLTIFYLFAC